MDVMHGITVMQVLQCILSMLVVHCILEIQVMPVIQEKKLLHAKKFKRFKRVKLVYSILRLISVLDKPSCQQAAAQLKTISITYQSVPTENFVQLNADK